MRIEISVPSIHTTPITVPSQCKCDTHPEEKSNIIRITCSYQEPHRDGGYPTSRFQNKEMSVRIWSLWTKGAMHFSVVALQNLS